MVVAVLANTQTRLNVLLMRYFSKLSKFSPSVCMWIVNCSKFISIRKCKLQVALWTSGNMIQCLVELLVIWALSKQLDWGMYTQHIIVVILIKKAWKCKNVSGQLPSAVMHTSTASIGAHRYTVLRNCCFRRCIIYFVQCGCTLNSHRETTL